MLSRDEQERNKTFKNLPVTVHAEETPFPPPPLHAFFPSCNSDLPKVRVTESETVMGILPCREIFEQPVYPTFVLPSRRDVLMLLPISILLEDEKYFNAFMEGRNDPFVLLCYAPQNRFLESYPMEKKCGSCPRLRAPQARHLQHDCRDEEEP